ncbi:MAG: hypothetical protein Q9165_006495 [Trypethelium subeluteriae]
MPGIDNADSFRSCQLDISEGLNAFSGFFENAIDDIALVETTISEDLADGQNAKLDASLKLLSEDNLRLLLPSDKLEDDEIHIIETTSPPFGNPALQIYQMQLMLLEQQNKKRLLMARQEHSLYASRKPAEVPKIKGLIASLGKGAYWKAEAIQSQAEAIHHSSRASKADCHTSTQVLPMTDAAMDSFSAPKRQKRDGPYMRWTKAYNGVTVDGDNSNLTQDESVEVRNHYFQIELVQRKFTGSANHPVPAFRDAPVPGAPSGSREQIYSPQYHLNGTVPLFDLQAFMDNDEDDIAFLILRTVECSEAAVLMATRTGHVQYSEGVYIKSKVLRDALHKITTCYFQQINLQPGPSAYMSSSEPFNQYDRIYPLDLFLFHHRQLLESHTVQCPGSKQHVDALLKYANTRYGAKFAEAKNLFANGLVNKAHVLFLFKPNEIIISGTYGKPTGFILQNWPEWNHQIYRKMHENAQAFRFERPADTHPFDRMPPYLDVEQKPTDVCFYLMPPDIHGFYLNEKKWIKLFVDCIEPVSWNKKAFERLVLPPQTKDLVRALVTVRTSQRGIKQGLGVAGKRTDITSGKGNGLIMLLHGGPGTGKTLTGESVAEIAEMPLYRVTCGDIGSNAEAVEKYLNTVLHLGKTWNCVLLLDEADVFLEERSMADLKRNSLVSVFLRILEYYDGILILTSNRVGIFDEAFKSRIQVALHYENLTRSTRKKIWQNFLDMLEEDEEDVNFDEIKFHLDDLAGKELNGRQIRNVLTTARQLALFRNERLDWEHLAQALAVSSDFSEYLKRMQGHTDDQRARDEGLR